MLYALATHLGVTDVGGPWVRYGFSLVLAALPSHRVFATRKGTLGLARGYIALSTTKEERTHWMSMLTAAQFAGYSITPGIAHICPSPSKQKLAALAHTHTQQGLGR